MVFQSVTRDLLHLCCLHRFAEPGITRICRGAIGVVKAVAKFPEKFIEIASIGHLVAREFFQAFRAVEGHPRALEKTFSFRMRFEITFTGDRRPRHLTDDLEKLADISAFSFSDL